MELTDLEICKRIAEIEGLDFYLLESGEDVYPLIKVWSDSALISKDTPKKFFTAHDYNPLTDDALCFQLMVKYDVKREWEAYDFIGWNYHCIDNKNPERITERTFFGKGKETADISPNKAICLAIIEAHKDNV